MTTGGLLGCRNSVNMNVDYSSVLTNVEKSTFRCCDMVPVYRGGFDTLLQPSSYDSAYISVFCNSLVAAAYESDYLTGSSARRWKGRRN